MTELEYLCGLVVLLLGFNLGYYEADKGLQMKDFKKIGNRFLAKFRKKVT